MCVQKPGDIIYFPDKWYHGTLNLDEFQLAWGGKPKSRPQQENSAQLQELYKYFPLVNAKGEKGMRGAEFPYSLSVHLDTYERECAKGQAGARERVDLKLNRMKTESKRISELMHNTALMDNGAFVFCAFARKIAASKICPVQNVEQAVLDWIASSKEMSPKVHDVECVNIKIAVTGKPASAESAAAAQSSGPAGPAAAPTQSRRASAADDWGNYCDAEVPRYDLKKWHTEHGNVLPDHPAVFIDDTKREGYEKYGSLEKFLKHHGDEEIGAAPEYGQAGGFGANVPNRARKQVTVRKLSQEWNDTHFYHSRFQCEDGTFCSKVWKTLGTPGLFEGPTESTNFLLGGPESGLPLHNHGKTWQGLVTGRKMWLLMPHDRVNMDLHDATGPYLFPLRGWVKSIKGQPLGKRPVICVQKAGEIFYFPDKWFHGTLNLDEFQLAWGGKPKDRPQQENSNAFKAIHSKFPDTGTMRGANFPYSFSVQMSSFGNKCTDQAAETMLEEPLTRQKKAADRLAPIVGNTGLKDNTAFTYCAVGQVVEKSKCPAEIKQKLASRWYKDAMKVSPKIFKAECPPAVVKEMCQFNPKPFLQNMQCIDFIQVPGSPGIASLQACYEKVVQNCAEPSAFQFRQGNGACHCIKIDTCQLNANNGISLYSTCGLIEVPQFRLPLDSLYTDQDNHRLPPVSGSQKGTPMPAQAAADDGRRTAESIIEKLRAEIRPQHTSKLEEHGKSAAEEWGNYCDPEVPFYDMDKWRQEHGDVLPDHPAVFRDNVDRAGYKMFDSLKKFIAAHGDEVVAGNPEYGQAGGFGANVPNKNVKMLSVKQMAAEWNYTHRYHSRFECAEGTFCSKIWKHLGTPSLFEGASESLNFLFGGPESGLPLHNHGKTWQGLLSGRKMWFLLPFDTVTMELHDATGPYLFPLRGWANSVRGLPLGKRPLVCVQKPGDIFYFPDKWFHGTLNLDEFQLAWGGKPKNRPEQSGPGWESGMGVRSPQKETIYSHFPVSKMRGADFPYSLAVRLGQFDRYCSQDEKKAIAELDEPLQRQKKAAQKLGPLVHNSALAENAAFAFCAVSQRISRSRCPKPLVNTLVKQWSKDAFEASPDISKMECPKYGVD